MSPALAKAGASVLGALVLVVVVIVEIDSAKQLDNTGLVSFSNVLD